MNITRTQAKAEIDRRKNNKVKGARYTPAAAPEMLKLTGAQLNSLIGAKAKTAKLTKAALKATGNKKLTTNQKANAVFAQVKATKGVRAAFQARKAFLLSV